jgi:hypothetical protein
MPNAKVIFLLAILGMLGNVSLTLTYPVFAVHPYTNRRVYLASVEYRLR